MRTVRIANYTFDKVAGTVTFSDLDAIDLGRVISITNVTRGKQMFFNKFPSNVGSVATNVLSLTMDTNNNGYDNTDKLLIEYAVDTARRTLLNTTQGATGFSSDFFNVDEVVGGMFYFDISALAGTSPTIVFKLQAKDQSGTYVDVTDFVTTSLTATGVKILTIHPSITPSANVKIADALPRKYRIAWTIGGTGGPSFTFTVGLDPIF